MSVGEAEGRHKSWRVTVTDRRGGRGTDYRVDDSDVDGGGGRTDFSRCQWISVAISCDFTGFSLIFAGFRLISDGFRWISRGLEVI